MYFGQDVSFDIVPTLPLTGLHYLVDEGGLRDDLFAPFNLQRLSFIKQLGFLTQPIYNRYDVRVGSLGEHTRWLHSLDVHAVGSAIGYNLDLPRQEMNELRTLCLTHDALTPAGGDSVKLVSPEDFDEDLHYHTLLEKPSFDSVAAKYSLRREVLLAGIKNKGVLGEILDIADKIAYVARDVSKSLHNIEAGVHRGRPGCALMLELLEKYPLICGLWDSVELQDGVVVFTNLERLVAFLKLRVLMFREFYYSPTARFGEFLISRLFVQVLLKRGKLSRDRLIEMTDSELLRLFDEEFEHGHVLHTCESDLARCEVFDELDEAQAFIGHLHAAGNVFAMLDDNRRSIKTGAHFRVATARGPMPLEKAHPDIARELERLASGMPLVHVYYLADDPMLPREVLAQLKKELA